MAIVYTGIANAITGIQADISASKAYIDSVNFQTSEGLAAFESRVQGVEAQLETDISAIEADIDELENDIGVLETGIDELDESKLDKNLGAAEEGRWLAVDGEGDIVTVPGPNTSEYQGPYADISAIPTPYDANDLYLVGEESPFTIYGYINGALHQLGNTAIDLDEYYTKDQVDDYLEDVVHKTGDETIEGNKSFVETLGPWMGDGTSADSIAVQFQFNTNYPRLMTQDQGGAQGFLDLVPGPADAVILGGIADPQSTTDAVNQRTLTEYAVPLQTTAGRNVYGHNENVQGEIPVRTDLDANNGNDIPTVAAVNTGLSGRVSKSGDTMTGRLNINSGGQSLKTNGSVLIGNDTGVNWEFLGDSGNYPSVNISDIEQAFGQMSFAPVNGNVQIKGVAAPEIDTDAANKAYVDSSSPSITSSTTDITGGTTALATGALYLVYE